MEKLPGQIKPNLLGVPMDTLVSKPKKGRPRVDKRKACVALYLDITTIEKIDGFVQQFGLSSRSDFVRTAINRRLQAMQNMGQKETDNV